MAQSETRSEKIKNAWINGKYSNRSQTYRTDKKYLDKIRKTIKKRWEEGIYKENGEKISKSSKGQRKYWLRKQQTEIFYKYCKFCNKLFIAKFNKRVFCSKSCAGKLRENRIVKIETRMVISKKLKGRCPKNLSSLHGINHWNWKGGIACEPYCEQWLDNDYKNSIKERDNFNCLNPYCNMKIKKLCIHHIDYNKKNCHPSNLITLCLSCHGRTHKDREWHTSWYKAIIYRRYQK